MAFITLMSRPWFSRGWVMQEFSLSPKTTARYGLQTDNPSRDLVYKKRKSHGNKIIKLLVDRQITCGMEISEGGVGDATSIEGHCD